MIDERNFFDQPIKNDQRTYNNDRKNRNGLGHNYTTGFLLDYPLIKKRHKNRKRDLSKQQELNTDPKPVEQVNFTRNLDEAGMQL